MELRYYAVPSLQSTLSQLTQKNAQLAIDFLRLTNSNCRFSSFTLKIWIEHCREAHAKRINNNRNIVELVVDDIIMARTAI